MFLLPHMSHFWMTLAGRDTPWSACWVPEASSDGEPRRSMIREHSNLAKSLHRSKETSACWPWSVVALIWLIIWSCIMVIRSLWLYDRICTFILVSVRTDMSPIFSTRACLGRYACSARCEARVSWRGLCTVFVLEGTPAARMKKMDYVFVCPLLQYTAHIFVGRPYFGWLLCYKVSTSGSRSEILCTDCHAARAHRIRRTPMGITSARQHVWRNHQPGRSGRSVGCFGLSSWWITKLRSLEAKKEKSTRTGPGFPRSPGIW